jgi:hypothetical protein
MRRIKYSTADQLKRECGGLLGKGRRKYQIPVPQSLLGLRGEPFGLFVLRPPGGAEPAKIRARPVTCSALQHRPHVWFCHGSRSGPRSQIAGAAQGRRSLRRRRRGPRPRCDDWSSRLPARRRGRGHRSRLSSDLGNHQRLDRCQHPLRWRGHQQGRTVRHGLGSRLCTRAPPNAKQQGGP